MWACIESYPRRSELVIEASTCVATMAQKPLPTAAVNCKVDKCSRFSECQTPAPDRLNGKKFCELLCVGG